MLKWFKILKTKRPVAYKDGFCLMELATEGTPKDVEDLEVYPVLQKIVTSSSTHWYNSSSPKRLLLGNVTTWLSLIIL
jgi:hypothetical protein